MTGEKKKLKYEYVVYILLGVIFFFWFSPVLKDQLGEYGGDSAQYIILAQSLLEGEGVSDDQLPR